MSWPILKIGCPQIAPYSDFVIFRLALYNKFAWVSNSSTRSPISGSHYITNLECFSETLSRPPSLICNLTIAENIWARSRFPIQSSKPFAVQILVKSSIRASSHCWILNLCFTFLECFCRAGLNRFSTFRRWSRASWCLSEVGPTYERATSTGVLLSGSACPQHGENSLFDVVSVTS